MRRRIARSVGAGSALFRHAAKRAGGDMRGNVVAYVALFFALTGTATALSGSNTVFSDDIVNSQVKTQDLANGQVKRGDLAENAVSTSRVADESLLGSDMQNESLSGFDVQNGTLGGADVAESSLTQVPSAAVGGRGVASTTDGTCDPDDAAFVSCGFVSLNVDPGPTGARALLVARIRGLRETGDGATGDCRLVTNTVGAVPNSTVPVSISETDGFQYLPFVGVTLPLNPAGVHSFGIECREGALGKLNFDEAAIEAVLISP